METLFLPKISRNLHTSFAAMAHLAEGVNTIAWKM
jgi:hypothetical protein